MGCFRNISKKHNPQSDCATLIAMGLDGSLDEAAVGAGQTDYIKVARPKWIVFQGLHSLVVGISVNTKHYENVPCIPNYFRLFFYLRLIW